jgi:hypothetical protein
MLFMKEPTMKWWFYGWLYDSFEKIEKHGLRTFIVIHEL